MRQISFFFKFIRLLVFSFIYGSFANLFSLCHFLVHLLIINAVLSNGETEKFLLQTPQPFGFLIHSWILYQPILTLELITNTILDNRETKFLL